MSILLKDTILRLRLSPSARFPSELEKQKEDNQTAMDKILSWRAEQRYRNRPYRADDSDPEDYDTDSQQNKG